MSDDLTTDKLLDASIETTNLFSDVEECKAHLKIAINRHNRGNTDIAIIYATYAIDNLEDVLREARQVQNWIVNWRNWANEEEEKHNDTRTTTNRDC